MPSTERRAANAAFSAALLLWLLICPAARATPTDAGPVERGVRGEASLDIRGYYDRDNTEVELYEARGSLVVPLSRRTEIYTDAGVRDERGQIDELFATYQAGMTRLRLGRFFLPIGIHSRSELYYTGFVELPLLKYAPLNGFVEFRSEQGFSVEGGSPQFRYEVGIIGGDGSQAALGLNRPNDLSVRLQILTGRLILGLNGYAGSTHTSSETGEAGPQRATRLGGLDWRYSVPEWIVRGELLAGSVGDSHPAGGYLDVIFHPTALPAWTFVGRLERVHLDRNYDRRTIGAKYVPGRGWAIQLNLIAEEPAIGGRGLHFQVLRLFEF